jgi:hypothetical protein
MRRLATARTGSSTAAEPADRGRCGQRGAAVVEFALVALLVCALLVGATEFGRAWYMVHMLSSAAREGARVGALMGGGEDREAAIRARIGEVLDTAGLEDYQVSIALSTGYGKPLRVEIQSPFESIVTRLIRVENLPLRLTGSAVFNQELP